MPDGQDQHHHRNFEVVEEPMDAASKSLADALRSSFSVLQGIMAVIVVLYLFSNVRSIGAHEQALILRLGRLLPDVHEAGLLWAYPFPIDEITPLPTRRSNDLMIESHTFHRREAEVGKPLSFIHRSAGEGLDPVLDGALLTADAGLVHMRWKLTYKIDDVRGYITSLKGDEVEAAEALLRVLVETVGIQLASELTAEELTRTKVDYVQGEMKWRINERLTALNSGIGVTLVEMPELTPPLQTRQAFDNTQRAENIRQQKIRNAEKEYTQILSQAAGAVHQDLVRLLEDIDRGGTQRRTVTDLRAELDRMLEERVEGKAGKRIKEVGAYRAMVVSQMQSDVERYRTLLPEYLRSPTVLINRLWEETRQQILGNSGVTKIYRPPGLKEFRVKIPLDPEQTRIEEAERLQKEEFDEDKLRRGPRFVPVGPEAD